MMKRIERARPYVKAIATDEKARNHAVRAAGQALILQRRLSGLAPKKMIVALIEDQETHDVLRELSKEAGGVKQRAERRRRATRVALLAGGSLVLVLTRPGVRSKLSSLAGRTRRSQDEPARIERSVEVNVPLKAVYNQWTQFEEFPTFMDAVEKVEQLDETHLRWEAVVAGKRQDWTAEITEQRPDERIAWRSVDGRPNSGVVTFRPLSDDSTTVTVRLQYEPEAAVEKVGGLLGTDAAALEADLARFKEMLEKRGRETGAWRGTVELDAVSSE